MAKTNTDVLVENLFSLDEPWQSHFLHYIAERVMGNKWDGAIPRRETVQIWLNNQNLQRDIKLLLRSWRR